MARGVPQSCKEGQQWVNRQAGRQGQAVGALAGSQVHAAIAHQVPQLPCKCKVPQNCGIVSAVVGRLRHGEAGDDVQVSPRMCIVPTQLTAVLARVEDCRAVLDGDLQTEFMPGKRCLLLETPI